MSVVPNPSSAPFRPGYDLFYQTNPILLAGGSVATSTGLLSITTLMPTNADGTPFATFLPVPGATLIANAVGTYPFANQAVAANAQILQPLTVSLLMIAPVNQPGGYRTKAAAFIALQAALNEHVGNGGYFVVYTPAFTYQNALMTGMSDVTPNEGGHQMQIQWQIDFVQPIITVAGAQSQENNLLNKLTSGQQISQSELPTAP